jgi:hypothetical protein
LLTAQAQATPASTGPQRVLDVCCSYGINAALLRLDLSLDDLHQRYTAGDVAELSPRGADPSDAELFAGLRRPDAPRVTGLDIARSAVAYGLQAGLLDDGWVEDLQADDPSGGLVAELAEVDLVLTTGGVGYVTEPTFDRLLSSSGRPRRGWPPGCCASTPYDAIAETLSGHGLVTEKLDGVTFRQRRFADDTGAGRRGGRRHRARAGPDRAGGRRELPRRAVRVPAGGRRRAAAAAGAARRGWLGRLARGGQAEVAGDELQLGAQLPHPLVDDQRAVAGVEAVHLVRGAAVGQRRQVVLDLPDRAARVVLAGQHEHRRAHLVDVGDRRAPPEDLAHLVGRAAEQGAVEGAQLLHLVLVGRPGSPATGTAATPTAHAAGCVPSPSSVR